MDYNKDVTVTVNLAELNYLLTLVKFSLLRDKDKLFYHDSFMLNSILKKLVISEELFYGQSE